jgi:hypothetical protein
MPPEAPVMRAVFGMEKSFEDEKAACPVT